MDSIVPVTDEQDIIVMPRFEAGWHGRCWLILKNGNRRMKVPASIKTWQAPETGDIHFIVSQMDVVHAEEWYG